MEYLIGIITVGIIGFITYKMIKSGEKEPSVPTGGGGSKPKDEPFTDNDGGIELPDNPKLRE